MPIIAPTLQTARLHLRPFTEADTDAMFALHSNRTVLRYWDSPPWTEYAQAERFIARCRQFEQDSTGARLAIIANGAFIGWCGVVQYDPTHRSAKLGYVLQESAWGQGYATEAATALLHWAFATLDLNRIQSETDTRNPASGRVLLKLGFQHEGTLRQDCIVEGDISDSHIYGLLKEDWESNNYNTLLQ